MNTKDLIKKLCKEHAQDKTYRLFQAYGFDDLNLVRDTKTNVRVLCPECETARTHHGHKDCSVNVATGQWHCFHCGAGGYVPTVVEYTRKNAKERAIENRRNTAPKDEPDFKRPDWVPEFQIGNVAIDPKPAQKEVLDYMTQRRRLSVEVLQRAKVTIPWREDKDHRLYPVIQFNYWDRGTLINWKQRTLDKGWMSFKDGKPIPYRIDSILRKEVCYITEGEIDALSMMEAGFPEVISVPNGGSSHQKWMDDYYETHLADKKRFYIAADFDEVGTGMMQEVVRRLGAERCFIVVWDEDCKDANEELVRHGVEGVQRCVEDAEPVPVGGIVTARTQQVEANLDRMIEFGLSPGNYIGLKNMDDKFRFETGRFVVVTGLPGDGKSELVDEMALRLSLLYGWKTAYFSPENTPVEYHYAKLISKLVGREFKLSKGKMTREIYEGSKKWLANNVFHILPDMRHNQLPDTEPQNHHEMLTRLFTETQQKRDSEAFYLDDVLAVARDAVQCLGVRQVVIDPFNSIEPDPKKTDEAAMNERRWILHVCNACRNFANRYGCLVYLVAHPRKMDRALLDGRKRRVEMNDISGSSDFGNKCDYCLCVERNDADDFVTVYVDKVKFKQNGSRSKFYLYYDKISGRYTNCDVTSHKTFTDAGKPAETEYTARPNWLYFNQHWVNEEGEVTIRTYLLDPPAERPSPQPLHKGGE